MKHDEIRDLLPWYITGSIEMEDAERVAAHLRECPDCRDEFVEAALARRRFEQEVRQSNGPARSVWDRLAHEIGASPEEFRVDVGSLLLGFRLGIVSANRQHPVRGELRLLGNRYSVIGSRTKGA
jgi:hypothetical protein